MPETNNSAARTALSAKKKRGNPDKTKPFRFQPGQSGNPSGRPRKPEAILSEAIRKQLAEMHDNEKTKAEAVASRLIQEAILSESPVPAIKEVGDRSEGKAFQSVRLDANIQTTSAERIKEIIARAGQRAAETSSVHDGGGEG